MSISVTCIGCSANFGLKDEFAGKKGKCPNCGTIIEIPTQIIEENTEVVNVNEEKGIFGHDIYGIKQKKLAINEKYFIKDKDNNDILFSMRKTYILKNLLAILVFLFCLFGSMFLGINFSKGAISIFAIMGAGFFLGIFLFIKIYPKRHISFFKNQDEINGEVLFEIIEDAKIQLINKTFTMIDKEKEIICKFRKNVFTDLIRKKWHMEFEGRHLIIKEDSIILGLLRRFMPYGNLIRTNFIFTEEGSDEILGIFKRKFELFDNYVLDLSNDESFRVPRQLSLGMAILLDTGEKR